MALQRTMSDISQVMMLIEEKRSRLGRPIVVGVSGYAGSGKSALVRSVVERDAAMGRMRGDDFLDPSRSHLRSDDWDGVERLRLVDEVLAPFRERRGGTFRHYDWSRRNAWGARTAAARRSPRCRPHRALPSGGVRSWISLSGSMSRWAQRSSVGCDATRLSAVTSHGSGARCGFRMRSTSRGTSHRENLQMCSTLLDA